MEILLVERISGIKQLCRGPSLRQQRVVRGIFCLFPCWLLQDALRTTIASLLDLLVPYQRRGKDIGVTVEPLEYRIQYRERVRMPVSYQIPTVASLKPKLRLYCFGRLEGERRECRIVMALLVARQKGLQKQ